MSLRALRREGHWPSLVVSLLHFEVSFGVWVLLGALGPFIARDLHLSPAAKGLVVGTPLLAAAAFRIIVGWAADRFGPRRVGTLTMALALAPLVAGWLGASSVASVLVVGVLLGVAGASFAIALPLASSHYPPALQGLALGIAGAGNSGTIIAALAAPRVAEHVGWHATIGLACIPVTLAAILFRVIAREAPWAGDPSRVVPRVRDVFAPLRDADCWLLSGLYAVSFGGYVGFTSYLTIFLVDRFSIARVTAGTLAAVAAGTGSLARPFAGAVADRIGGTRVLAAAAATVTVMALVLSSLPSLAPTVALFVVMLGALGAANGAVFQLVPLRFRESLGRVTGIVGAAGGVGGFLLPTLLGAIRDATGSYRFGFLVFGAVAAGAAAGSLSIRIAWLRRTEVFAGSTI